MLNKFRFENETGLRHAPEPFNVVTCATTSSRRCTREVQ